MARLNSALPPSSPADHVRHLRAGRGATLRRAALAWVTLAIPAAFLCGCAGPPVVGAIQGEPVCADFATGVARTPMEGGLRLPVRLRILDGKTVMTKLVLHGKRSAAATPSRTLVADDNAEYTVEWAQCVNERAPVAVGEARARARAQRPENEPGGAYECGEAEVYKTDKLVTKKGDAASHNLTFVTPPKTECWQGDAPATPPSVASAATSASASPEPAPPSSAAASAAPAMSAAPGMSAAPAASTAPGTSATPGMSAAPTASGPNNTKSTKGSVPPK